MHAYILDLFVSQQQEHMGGVREGERERGRERGSEDKKKASRL